MASSVAIMVAACAAQLFVPGAAFTVMTTGRRAHRQLHERQEQEKQQEELHLEQHQGQKLEEQQNWPWWPITYSPAQEVKKSETAVNTTPTLTNAGLQELEALSGMYESMTSAMSHAQTSGCGLLDNTTRYFEQLMVSLGHLRPGTEAAALWAGHLQRLGDGGAQKLSNLLSKIVQERVVDLQHNCSALRRDIRHLHREYTTLYHEAYSLLSGVAVRLPANQELTQGLKILGTPRRVFLEAMRDIGTEISFGNQTVRALERKVAHFESRLSALLNDRVGSVATGGIVSFQDRCFLVLETVPVSVAKEGAKVCSDPLSQVQIVKLGIVNITTDVQAYVSHAKEQMPKIFLAANALKKSYSNLVSATTADV